MKTIVMSLAAVLVCAGVSFAQCGGCDEAKAKPAGEACEGEGQAKKAEGCCPDEAAPAQQADAGCGSEEGCGGCADVVSNPVFEQMKSLEGEWVGQKGEDEIHVTYHLTANGSALIETLMPGTPNEMVTVYHQDGADLVLTHYCASGSQPMMKMTKIKDGAFHFEHVGGTNCDPAKGFMGGLVMTLAEGKLKHNWTVLKDGKPVQQVEFELSRARETK